MTEIYQIDLTKAQLAAMPDAERRLLLLLGHATNEINVFEKLILMSGQGTPAHQFVDLVQAGQTFILMRTLIGKLHEAWELFRTRLLSDRQVAEFYLPKLDGEALEALESLKRHFGTRSPLTLIRNRFSFHYRDEWDQVEQSFQQIPDDEPWQFYLSNVRGNIFFYASELVVACGVINLANPSPDQAEPYLAASTRSFKALCELIVEVSGHILTLFGACLGKIVSERLPSAKLIGSTELPGLRSLRDMELSFYIDDTEFKPKG
jgi:hypothetical protein